VSRDADHSSARQFSSGTVEYEWRRRSKQQAELELSSRLTNRLLDPNQQHTLGHDAIRVVEVQHADTGLQAIKPKAGPGREVIADTLVVHDFEPARIPKLALVLF
jgi:hypothetical protein